jgi:hypothetical protein
MLTGPNLPSHNCSIQGISLVSGAEVEAGSRAGAEERAGCFASASTFLRALYDPVFAKLAASALRAGMIISSAGTPVRKGTKGSTCASSEGG